MKIKDLPESLRNKKVLDIEEFVDIESSLSTLNGNFTAKTLRIIADIMDCLHYKNTYDNLWNPTIIDTDEDFEEN